MMKSVWLENFSRVTLYAHVFRERRRNCVCSREAIVSNLPSFLSPHFFVPLLLL